MFLENSFFLFTAPPAWGKTRLFRQWVVDDPRPYLYVSPLRALATEVAQALADHPGLLALDGANARRIWQQWAAPASHARILIVTPEQLGDFNWDVLAQAVPEALVVWDEVHLIPLWGFGFREAMLQQWWGFCATRLCGAGLTATACDDFLSFLDDSLLGAGRTLLRGDAGNFQFKTKPTVVSFPQDWLTTLLDEKLREQADNTLVFCAHRAEVDRRVEECRRNGIAALGCKGGETAVFQRELARHHSPLAIFATSCLSHGVNLPSIARVVVLYHESDPAIYHQMITRGGRRGEAYEVWRPWCRKTLSARGLWALARAGLSVGLAKAWLFVGEWWDGTGRPRHTDYTAEGA